MYLQTLRGTADPLLDSEPWGRGLGSWGLDLGLGLVLEGFGLDVYTIIMLGAICYANETCVYFVCDSSFYYMCYLLCVGCHAICTMRSVCVFRWLWQFLAN